MRLELGGRAACFVTRKVRLLESPSACRPPLRQGSPWITRDGPSRECLCGGAEPLRRDAYSAELRTLASEGLQETDFDRESFRDVGIQQIPHFLESIDPLEQGIEILALREFGGFRGVFRKP